MDYQNESLMPGMIYSNLSSEKASPKSVRFVPGKSSLDLEEPEKTVDDLLRAFSDTENSFEDVDSSWESWGYSRISAF